MARSCRFWDWIPRSMREYSRLFFIFLALFCCSLQGMVVRAKTAPEEVAALKQIAAKLKIPTTLWNFDFDPCTEWEKITGNPYVHNITCLPITSTATNSTSNSTFFHVSGIEIKAADLTGVLPEEIGKLKYLNWIDLSRNYINGTIPAANWTSLPLTNLNLLANRISGVIPPEIGEIQTLETLFIEGNLLHGRLPRSLGNLTNLKRLLLSCNNFSGELPESMANMKSITEIRLDSTEISGKIPRFVGNWRKLRRLDLQGTLMEGPFPPEFGSLLAMAELRVSDLKNVGGSFPPIEQMLDMQQLVLRNCSLSGSIPDYISKFTQLQTLDLSFNNLTGQIPTSFQNLGRLTTMFLTSNRLTGTIPEWIKKPQQNMDISYNTFTDVTSAPANCEQETRNFVASFSSTTENLIPSCLRKDMPCHGTPKNYEFFVNCGGESVIVDGKEYERDVAIEGISKYYVSPSGKWAYSSTGNFVGGNQQKFTAQNGSILMMPNAQLYTSARLNPLSLKYYGLCLQRGNYTVLLHFSEIIFTPGPTYWSLGRRVFDVSIQGRKVLEDFNIAEAANGIGKEVIMNFTALVESGTLEIHLEWAGKGTNSIPYRSVYGPLISAISVTPNFKPRIFKDYKFPVSASIGIAVATTVFVMMLVLGAIWFFLRKKAIEEDELKGLDFQTNCYRLKQIKAATGNFDPQNKIGEGGFGPVYKGVLPDGSLIAVKQLSSKSKQGNREFVTEVGMISGLEHPNLVRLYGCCVEGHQLLLIYEYMENNCLGRALFGPVNTRLKLDWAMRRKICIGVARGLAYLHGESRLKIVHRDIKATNVLLDKDLNAKISDFGLAKLDEEDKTHISTRIAGTMGYMAPEYAMRGYLTDKADVYSFGVVTLEIVSGKSNTNFLPKDEFMYLLDWAYVLEKRGTLLELVDPALGKNFNVEEARQMLNLGLLCASPSPALRPPMSSVVAMLEGRMPVEVPAVEFTMAESIEMRFKSSDIFSSKDDGNSQSASMAALWANSSASPAQSKFHSATSRLLAEQVHL